MSAADLEPCRLLEWDTEFFHFRIARVQSDVLNDGQAAQIDEWNRANRIRCAYFLARADDPATIHTAGQNGFQLVDIRVTFERQALPPERPAHSDEIKNAPIRAARDMDLPQLQALARTAHAQTRFFRDGRFPRDRAEALYATWITMECQGRAQKVFVATSAVDEPLGYLSCHLDPERREGQIGLVGVASAVRGQGIGQHLVLAGCNWLVEHGTQSVSVVTQGANTPALRLYERCGFLTRELQLWYHKWYPASGRNNA
jgi:ribosomal protein S18 acetylase RimI-like enzyme